MAVGHHWSVKRLLNYVINNEDMNIVSIKATVSEAFPLILGFPQLAGQNKEHPYVCP
jgi:hypothetical protein